ncbi:hypothetical protein [Mycobacterium uberis]|uniref:hypothetical protein n=1 Tax=Mycobacterium uberis TaxID=2162698 RepID=UPI000E303143|nr:hypothetical protein [Mycobacterium uberis]
MADQHSVLLLRPESPDRLSQVDAIVTDPQVLCTDSLRVAQVRSVDDELSVTWNRAQIRLANDSCPR